MKRTFALASLLVVTAVFCATASRHVIANPIIDGRQWLQPLAVRGSSWDEINAVCVTGSCVGNLNGDGFDLTGWQWATIFEVGELFAATSPHPGGVADYQDGDFNFLDNFLLATGFEPTFLFGAIPGVVDVAVTLVGGLTSTLDATTGEAYAAVLATGATSYIPDLSINGTRISTALTLPTDGDTILSLGGGGWFYRDVVTVPVANSLSLVALAGLLLSWRRRAARIQVFQAVG